MSWVWEREESITEPGTVAPCNHMVKYIMYCMLHMLHYAQQGGIKSWSQAKTNKGVSALSPAAEFSFYNMTEVKEFIVKQSSLLYSDIQQGCTVEDVICGLRQGFNTCAEC